MHLSVIPLFSLCSTIVGSMLCASCSAPPTRSSLPVMTGVAPAELAEPWLPPEPLESSAPSSGLTLDALLRFADSHAPMIQRARAQAAVSSADLVAAAIRLPANPQLSAGVGGRLSGGAVGFDVEAAIQQQFEVYGEPGLRRAAAEDGQRVAEAVVNEVRWAVHVEVHRLVLALQLMQERRNQSRRFISFSESMRRVVEQQVNEGESSPLALLVADSDFARAREVEIEAEQSVAMLHTRLAALVGWQGAELPAISAPAIVVRHAPGVDELLTMMAAQHPSLRTRELAVAAGQSQLLLETREARPEPAFGVSYAHESAPGPFGGSASNIWMFNISVPLPAWRTNQAGRARAEAEVLAAAADRDATVAELRGQLTEAVVALNAAAERVALYETEIIPQIEQNLTLVERAWELGELDIHQVSQTRERLFTATTHYTDARIAWVESAAVLEGLTGTELWVSSGDES